MLAFSAIDYWFQRGSTWNPSRCPSQEVKEERKMYEGDPLTRSRLRERMREIMRRNMLKAVPKADVVITNPTHYAVALEYNRAAHARSHGGGKGGGPDCAEDQGSRRGEQRARHGEQAAGAGALPGGGDRRRIPEKFYEVMSIILAEVYKPGAEDRGGRTRRRR